jgi:hypothetical protein
LTRAFQPAWQAAANRTARKTAFSISNCYRRLLIGQWSEFYRLNWEVTFVCRTLGRRTIRAYPMVCMNIRQPTHGMQFSGVFMVRGVAPRKKP